MLPMPVLVLAAILAGGYYLGDAAVAGIKKVDHAAVHVVKVVGKKVLHVVTFGKKTIVTPLDVTKVAGR